MPTFWRAKQQCELSVINTYWIPFLLAGGGHPWLIYCLCAFGSTLKFSWKIRVALCVPGKAPRWQAQKNARASAGKKNLGHISSWIIKYLPVVAGKYLPLIY
ncbi:TPA: hypothetical protein ACH7Z5_002391, partial [Escherichia coli]